MKSIIYNGVNPKTIVYTDRNKVKKRLKLVNGLNEINSIEFIDIKKSEGWSVLVQYNIVSEPKENKKVVKETKAKFSAEVKDDIKVSKIEKEDTK